MRPARIVIVDDSTADVNLLRLALDQQPGSYVLEVLETAEEAFQFVKDHRDGLRAVDPCVLLLDLHLPRYDGVAILRAVRKAPSLAHIHVVVLSGMASPAEKENIAALGAIYREKPSDLRDYLELGADVMAMCGSATAAVA